MAHVLAKLAELREFDRAGKCSVACGSRCLSIDSPEQAAHVKHAEEVRNAWLAAACLEAEEHDRGQGLWPGGSATKDEPPTLFAGDAAQLVGLVSRRDLNGRAARLLHFAKASGRWAIECLPSGEKVKVRPANLRRLADADLVAHVLSYLRPAELLRCRTACALWRVAGAQDATWLRHCGEQRHGKSERYVTPPNLSRPCVASVHHGMSLQVHAHRGAARGHRAGRGLPGVGGRVPARRARRCARAHHARGADRTPLRVQARVMPILGRQAVARLSILGRRPRAVRARARLVHSAPSARPRARAFGCCAGRYRHELTESWTPRGDFRFAEDGMLDGHPTERPPFNVPRQQWELTKAGCAIAVSSQAEAALVLQVGQLRVRRAADWSWWVEGSAELLLELSCTEAEKRALLAAATERTDSARAAQAAPEEGVEAVDLS